MRFGKVESIKVKIIDPWLYLPQPSNPDQRVVYVEDGWDQDVVVEKKNKSEEEKRTETVKKYGSATSIGIFILGLLAIALRTISGEVKNIFVYLIRLFNILEIVSNMGKINVSFGSKIKIAFKFIESLSLPEIPLLGKLSPIQDSEPEDVDASAYQIIPKGSRAKMTQENGQVLLASGQNFMLSLLIVIFWVLMTLLEFCMSNRSKFLQTISFLYQILIGLMFFEFQMISNNREESELKSKKYGRKTESTKSIHDVFGMGSPNQLENSMKMNQNSKNDLDSKGRENDGSEGYNFFKRTESKSTKQNLEHLGRNRSINISVQHKKRKILNGKTRGFKSRTKIEGNQNNEWDFDE